MTEWTKGRAWDKSADSYRVVEGFTYVSVQAIKNGFVTFCVNVPRNRHNRTRAAAKAAGIYDGF